MWGNGQQEWLSLGSKILEWNSYLMVLGIRLLSVAPLFSCVQVKDATHQPLWNRRWGFCYISWQRCLIHLKTFAAVPLQGKWIHRLQKQIKFSFSLWRSCTRYQHNATAEAHLKLYVIPGKGTRSKKTNVCVMLCWAGLRRGPGTLFVGMAGTAAGVTLPARVWGTVRPPLPRIHQWVTMSASIMLWNQQLQRP